MSYNDIKTRILRVDEIIILSFRIFFENLKFIIPICIGIYLPLQICLTLLPENILMNLVDPAIYISSSDMTVYIKYISIMFALFIIFVPLAIAAISHVTIYTIEGVKISFNSIIDASLSRWFKLIYTTFLYYGIIMITSVLIIPAVYFAVAFIFCQCVVAVSNKYGFSSMIISRVLIKGRWFKGFLLTLLTFWISSLISFLISNIFALLGIANTFIGSLFSSLIAETISTFSFISIAIFYINIHYNFNVKGKIK